MKGHYRATFSPTRSCLINLPSALTRSLASNNIPAQNVVAVLTVRSKCCYAGWTGHTTKDPETFEVDPVFARNLGMKEGSEVLIELEINPREADVIWVEPQSSDDWEIMELHASFLELNLLNQIRAVSTAHSLIVYLNAHTTATIIVRKLEPDLLEGQTFAKISPSAEVIVAPKARELTRPGTARASVSHEIRTRALGSEPPRKAIFLRAVQNNACEMAGLHIFVPNSLLRTALGFSRYVTIQIVLPPGLQPPQNNEVIDQLVPGDGADSKNMKLASQIVVRAHGEDDILEGHVGLSPQVVLALDIQTGSRVRIGPAASHRTETVLICHEIATQSKKKEIKIGAKEDPKLIESFKAKLSQLGEGPVTHGLKISDRFIVGLQSQDDWTTLETMDKLTFKKGEDVIISSARTPTLDDSPLEGADKIKLKVHKIVRRPGAVLLSGSRGSGKSSIASHCAREAQRLGYHVVIAECAKFAEERIANIKEALHQWLATAAWYEPSVILIDDLDRLCPAEVEHADSTRARQVAEIFLSTLRQFTSRHAISLIATCQSKDTIHDLLTTSHVFDETISLKPPDKTARRAIIASFLSEAEASDVDWLEVANMTDGYLAGDLRFLTERAKHERLMREMFESTSGSEVLAQSMKTADYHKAIAGFIPASLRGVKLQKSTVEWKDIGGLEETRQILLETLEWPTRYAPIFANCPLRLRSGLLLYGYPGCGKTLLASAVASQCGLNFISVKGPEILNKYIGASEKSVRDLFDRAQAAKPCVLFFDEFDSIAPKRGHDSTGVTDRVVNQMLTQMDGAEGLDGVYVLAATSRPDLIDPALLRPGRLDKSLLCNMPTSADRLSILEALSRKMHVSSDVDLEELAERTAGFTGADLQAVLYNAHLEAIHDVIARKEEESLSQSRQLEQSEVRRNGTTTFTRHKLAEKIKSNVTIAMTSAESAAAAARVEAILSVSSSNAINRGTKEQPTEQVIEIRWSNLQKSLGSTKPSISVAERHRLDKVYHDFVDGRSADGLPNGQGTPGEQRATLA